MKTIIRTLLTVCSIVLLCAGAAQADHYRGGGYHGGGWGWGLAPFLFGAAAIASVPYYYPYYATPPVVVMQPSTEMYIQQSAPQAAPQAGQSFWYYCQNPQGYYPYVKSCPGGWMKVVPTPPPPE